MNPSSGVSMKNKLECSIEFLIGKITPREQNFLIIADINTGGEFLFLELIQEYIERGFKTVLVLLDALPRSVLKELAGRESDNFMIVNTYSDVETKYNTSIVLHELKLTLKALRKQLKSDKPLIMFFWSLNPLFIHYSNNDIVRFFLENTKHAITNNSIEFFLISKGLVEELIMRRLISIAHSVIQLERDSSTNDLIKISYLKTLGTIPIERKIDYKFKIEVPIWDSKIWFH